MSTDEIREALTAASAVENDEITPAQVVALEYEGYLHSRNLDPAWIAGWHAAINHAVRALRKHGFPPERTPSGGDA